MITGSVIPPAPLPARKPARGLWATIVAGLIALAKFSKGALVGLQFLKFGKLLLTASSMLAMVWAYSGRFGWTYSAGVVFLILVHELGHGFAARCRNLDVGLPIFIPFIGAFIALKEKPKSAYEDFFIGAGGPVAGVTASLLCLFVADYFGGQTGKLLLGIGFSTLTMNLFNLIPIGFLDGGRMVSPFGRTEWLLGFPLLVLAAYGGMGLHGENFNPIVFLLLLGAFFRAAMSFRRGPRIVQYKQAEATGEERLIASATYFLLAALGIYLVHTLWDSLAL